MKHKAHVTAELVRPPSTRGCNVFRNGEAFKVSHSSDVEIAELILRQRTSAGR